MQKQAWCYPYASLYKNAKFAENKVKIRADKKIGSH